MKRKVVIALNAAWNLVNFRAGLIRALVAAGYEVVAVAPRDEYATRLADLGCRFVDLPMDSRGTHPLKDALLLIRYWRLLRAERPDVLLAYTVKPNIYGSLAARALGIPVVNNIAGLGAVFIRTSWLTDFVRRLYRFALSGSSNVFFQNEDDRRLFVETGLVSSSATALLPGSGVDLRHFAVAPPPGRGIGGSICFTLIARMLWDKGVGEFVEAARLLRDRYPRARWHLVGFVDVENPAGISRQQVQRWVDEGLVTYRGATDDVRPFIAEADCIVLPSYREGTPRALLEAAAMGRPIVTTDAVGCREVVDHGANGYLCRPQDAADLASKLEQFIALPAAERTAMGLRGRQKMERQFDETIVIERYLAAVRRALGE